jgi:predicted Zn-dependent protease
MSEQDEIAFGKDVAAALLGAAQPVNDVALQEYVNRVGTWVALHGERPALPWRFAVIDSDNINAFATPGGYVFITRGMFLSLRSEDELAGVLAHEIGHVEQRHALETMKKGAWATLGETALSEYAAQRGKADVGKLVSGATEIYTRGLDKDDEYAADASGVVLAARAGYDPYGLPGVLHTLASINPESDTVALMFKTHPNSNDRLELLTTKMEDKLEPLLYNKTHLDRFNKILNNHISHYIPKK